MHSKQLAPAPPELQVWEIGFADMLILNKTDLAGPAQVEKVRAWIDSHLNRVRIVEADHCRVPLEVLLAVGRFDAGQLVSATPDTHANAGAGHASHDHGRDFDRWSYETEEPLSLGALREMVKRRLPRGVYRCKGIVHSSDAPEQRSVLQVVGRRSDLTLDAPWEDETPSTRIVAIGDPGQIMPEELQSLFDDCIAGRARREVEPVGGLRSVTI